MHRCTHNQRRRASCRQTLFAFSSFVKFQAAIDAIDTFVIPLMAQPSQSVEQLPKPLFRSPLGQLQEQLHYFLVPVRLRLIPIDRAAQADYLTGLSFAYFVFLAQAHNQLPFDRGLYSFFSSTSFKMRCSKDRSAYMCLSRRFSSSNSRKRRMSAASMPPYFVFHL